MICLPKLITSLKSFVFIKDFISSSFAKVISNLFLTKSWNCVLCLSTQNLSDKFCVDRHKTHFLDLVRNKLDITFANEDEITSLIDTKNFNEVIEFAKQIKKLIIITRGEKGAISIKGDEIKEISVKKNLDIIDLTGAGDLFAAGYLHGLINNLSSDLCLEKGTEMSSKIIQQIGARL